MQTLYILVEKCYNMPVNVTSLYDKWLINKQYIKRQGLKNDRSERSKKLQGHKGIYSISFASI